MEKQLYVGIDVSKGYADFVIFNHDKAQTEPVFQLDDNQQGHRQLESILTRYLEEGYQTIYCGAESTGGYENKWIDKLQNLSEIMPLKVARLNARAVKGISNASLKRTVTDAVSAENITFYLMNFTHKIDYLQNKSRNTCKEARSHYGFIKMLVKQRVQLQNRLEKILYQYYGSLLVYCRHVVPVWMLQLLIKYGTPQKIKKAGIKGLVKFNNITQEKATLIMAKIELLGDVPEHIGFLIQQLCLEIQSKQEQIETNKSYLIDLFKHDEQVKLLASIPGIGNETAVVILLEIEDIARFTTSKKMASFFGLNPEFKQSGDGSWGHQLSKKGRPTVRGILYMACLTAIRKNSIIKARYAAARANGRSHYDAMGIIMHKLLRVVYGVLKNKSVFNAETDERNQVHAEEKQKANNEKSKKDKRIAVKSKRRYQEEKTEDVPLSLKAAQKREKAAST